MFRKLLPLIVFFVAFGMLRAAESNGLFSSATQAYQGGNYQRAVDDYEKIVSSGEYTAGVFYNLGSAYQMLNKPVDAALNYRRALMLSPGLLQARINLANLAQTKGIPLPPFTWRESVSTVVPPIALLYVGAFAGWVGIYLLVFGFLKKAPRFWWMSIALVLFIGGKSLALVGYLCEPKVVEASTAIITASESVAAHAAPADSSANVEKLMPGTGVNIISNRGPWSYCQLPDKARAWLPTQNLTRVALSDSSSH
ncbi:MAG: hypothetical protein ABI443_00935 [Chthoniobacterales bacterium]